MHRDFEFLSYHRTAVLVFPSSLMLLDSEEKQDIEEFQEALRLGQGSGITETEKPDTSEQSQEMGETGFIDKVILERHM